jgi:hypothetical protein
LRGEKQLPKIKKINKNKQKQQNIKEKEYANPKTCKYLKIR